MTEPPTMLSDTAPPIIVACPDARPPAYQAVIGLARAGLLHSFVTGFYYRGDGAITAIGRRLAPAYTGGVQRLLRRRHDPDIPAARVRSAWSFDAALRLENRLAARRPRARGRVARWRTERFDRQVCQALDRSAPSAMLAFSDVGSHHALPYCRKHGIQTVLSMVHGDVREEQQVLDRQAESAPEFFPIYLGDGALDRDELRWLHDRRLQDLELAGRILVPSEHIADTLVRYGTDRQRINVIPYAADTRRFAPPSSKRYDDSCTFLFAGGITQRKGIKYLLEAWQRIRRPGWRLQLLGALPSNTRPLEPYLDQVECLGQVSHSEMPARLTAADVFVFPSLFEGSAVVTYEAMAAGLPSIVTAESGSVIQDGVEGVIVPSENSAALAAAMERLGRDPELRESMSLAARRRALDYDWPRYHSAIAEVMRAAIA